MAFFPKSIDQVDQIAAEVARDIRSQYTLGYHSTKPTTVAGFRRVEVTAEQKGLGKLTVRTRTGYFPSVRTPRQLPRWQGRSRRMSDDADLKTGLEQLAHLKAMGEKAYDDMYEARSAQRRNGLLQRRQGMLLRRDRAGQSAGAKGRGRGAARPPGPHQSSLPQSVHVVS